VELEFQIPCDGWVVDDGRREFERERSDDEGIRSRLGEGGAGK
jgi:hypothetical protein